MNAATVENLAQNTKWAKAVYSRFLPGCKDPTQFQTYFHLRPTSDGVTIVSTLPDAPMRGLDCKDPGQLEQRLGAVRDNWSKLVSEDSETVLCTLSGLGFQRREKNDPDQIREEDIQARFIRGMVKGENAYQGIQFVASELNLELANRFDVVGVKDGVLYIFELKRGRTTKALDQVKGYCDLVRKNEPAFTSVLADYPNLSVPAFSKVQGVAVMKKAENSSDKKWEKLVKDDKFAGETLQIWFFEDALSFTTIK